MAKPWNDSATAQKFRDVVERITRSVLTIERPESFPAQVDSIDRIAHTGTARRPGMQPDEPSIPFKFPGHLMPGKANGLRSTTVELEGKPGRYWLKRVLGGDYQSHYPRLENPRIFGGTFGEIETESNFLIQYIAPHAIGETTHAGAFNNVGETWWSQNSFVVEMELNMELFGTIKKSYKLLNPQINTNGEWQVLAPLHDSGPSANTDISLEIRVNIENFELRVRKLREQSFNNSSFMLKVKIIGESFHYDGTLLNTVEASPRPTEYYGRDFRGNENSAINQQGLFQSGVRHLIEARQHYNLVPPTSGVQWDGTLLKWNQPFRVLGLGVGDLTSVGALSIDMPAVGSTLDVYGSLNGYSATVGANGIPMRFDAADLSLYYEPKYLSDGSTVAGRFYLVGKSVPFRVPSHWILLAATNGPVNGQGNSLFLGNGTTTDHWRDVAYQNSWGTYSASFHPLQYRNVGDRVELRGMASGGSGDDTMFTLPVGFRPAIAKLTSCAFASKATGGASAGTSHTHTLTSVSGRLNINSAGSVYTSGAPSSVSWIGLDGVTFELSA